MDKRLFQALYFFIFIAVNCSAETGVKNYDEPKFYDPTELFAKVARDFQNYVHLKAWKTVDNLQLQDINEDFKLKPLNFELRIQLHNASKCLQDLFYMVQNIRSEWGLKMIDSYGKPESGILNGNFRWIGDYNECVGIRVSNPDSNSTAGNFRGKYCSLTWSLKSLNLSLPFSFVSGVCIPDSCSASELQHDALQLMQMAGALPALNDSNSTLNSDALKCKPTERHLNAAAISIIALLSIFGALSVLGSSVTVVKYFKSIIKESRNTSFAGETRINNEFGDDKNNMLHKQSVPDDEALLEDGVTVTIRGSLLKKMETFLVCFCVFTNGAKLLNTSSSEGELLCVHGIRFLSMSWVILGHTYIFGYQQMKNMVEVIPMLDTFPFQAILQAFYSVDSFFILSGFLLAFLSMKEFSRTKGKISWPYFYIHRYLRLTPMYMITLGFFATVYLYLGSGPYWPDGDYDPTCKNNWWRNLIYINNFDLEQAGQCMSWSWYLANDMQFFIISPLFLIALWSKSQYACAQNDPFFEIVAKVKGLDASLQKQPELVNRRGVPLIHDNAWCHTANATRDVIKTLDWWPKIGYSLLAIFLLASCLSNFIITYHFDLTNGLVTLLNNGLDDMKSAQEKFTEYFTKLYVKPYTRIGPYLVGMFTGFIYFKRKASNAPKHSLVFLTVGWIVASSVTLATVYGLYHTHPGLVARSFYNALSRVCYAAGLSWVIYICLMGQGGFINSLLSFKLFIPLSRLTYSAYLIHPMVVGGYLANLKSSLMFSHPTVVTMFLGFMLVTYALSLPVSLILESPIVALEKLIRKKFTTEKKNEAVN